MKACWLRGRPSIFLIRIVCLDGSCHGHIYRYSQQNIGFSLTVNEQGQDSNTQIQAPFLGNDEEISRNQEEDLNRQTDFTSVHSFPEVFVQEEIGQNLIHEVAFRVLVPHLHTGVHPIRVQASICWLHKLATAATIFFLKFHPPSI